MEERTCKKHDCPMVRKNFASAPTWRCMRCAVDSQAKWRKANPVKYRAHLYRINYGITINDYDLMLRAQGGRCAICKSDHPKASRNGHFAVDHDHTTVAVRGLLCGKCNAAIGLLEDSSSVADNAAAYLRKHGK